MRILLCSTLLLLTIQLLAQNQSPEITNVISQYDDATQQLVVGYDVFDAEGEAITVTFLISDNDGESYDINTTGATGDLGASVLSGTGKSIVWDATGLLSGSGDYKVKLVADDLFQINIQSIVDQVDSNRLLRDMQFIEGVRHRTANPNHLEAVKDTIEQRFLAASLETMRQDFPRGTYTGQNILGRLEGTTQSDSTYIIDGHFDTVNDSPGADDNGSAVAGLLEAARVLAPYRFEKSLRFLGFDLEEAGLLGSVYFADNGLLGSEVVKGVFNMEMIGYYTDAPNSQTLPAGFEILYPDVQAALIADEFRGNYITNIGDQNSAALIAAYDAAAAQYVPGLKTVSFAAPAAWQSVTPDLGRSDHAPFWVQNIPALMLTDGANFRNPNYHTANDLVSTLDFTFMSNVVKALVGAVAEEAGVQHSTVATIDFSVVSSVSNTLDCVLRLSPVPVKGSLELEFGLCSAMALELRLYDASGRVFLQRSVNANDGQRTSLDLEGLSPGVYMLNLRNGKQLMTRKVVVE
ncbi:MAG: M28 family peptidase [Saprospiraceae bacterium]